MAFDDVVVDYGELGPEHFERFGLRHYARIRSRYKSSIFVDVNLNAVIVRLGLKFLGWSKTWQGVHHYAFDVHGRNLEIRRYSDGRIKIFLDNAPVYTENIAMVMRHGERYRDMRVWKDPAPDTLEAREKEEIERATRLDAVRAKLPEHPGSTHTELPCSVPIEHEDPHTTEEQST